MGLAAEYRSPYRVEFSVPVDELIPDVLQGDRAAPEKQSPIPFSEWNGAEVRRRYGAWGPPGIHHLPPPIAEGKLAEWKRQRVLAIGLRYIGLSYQHHHLPDFDPPKDWPWKEVASGENGRGVECSNFTTFVYNLALGLKIDSGILLQAQTTEARLADGKRVALQQIQVPSRYADFSRILKTADLLFIKNSRGNVSHVVLWVGGVGRSPDQMPLIPDSTGEGRRDSSDNRIPAGIHLRPFTPNSWYFKSASHALRLIP